MFWKRKVREYASGIAWFNYSVIFPHQDDLDHRVTVIGHLLCKNTGTKSLHQPIICLRIKPPEGANLGGKIGSASHSELTINETNSEAWYYFQENWKETSNKTGEHWLKPEQTHSLAENDTLAFSFELDVSALKEEKYVLMEGFFYCDELSEGIRTLNNITINF